MIFFDINIDIEGNGIVMTRKLPKYTVISQLVITCDKADFDTPYGGLYMEYLDDHGNNISYADPADDIGGLITTLTQNLSHT